MIPNLPRQLLWTDMMNYSEIKSNQLCKLLDGLLSVDPDNSKITSDFGEETMLKLYNEAFYLSTRIVYEQDADARPETYMEKIQTDLGDGKKEFYVVFLMFYVLCIQSNKSKEVRQFTDRLQKKYLTHISSKLMNLGQKVFKSWIKKIGFDLKPCPYPADKLQDLRLDWHEITQGYSKKIINELLLLWDSDEEKGKVIRLIELSNKSSCSVLKDKGLSDDINDTHNRDTIVVSEKFLETMIMIDKADEIIDIINRSLKGKTQNKDKMRPFTAAVAANVMRAPTWGVIKESCGNTFISKTRYYDYLKEEKYSGDGTFDQLKAEFKKILDS